MALPILDEIFNILSQNTFLAVTWYKSHQKLFQESENLFMKCGATIRYLIKLKLFLFLQQKVSRVFCNCFCLDRNSLRIFWFIFCFRNRFVNDFFIFWGRATYNFFIKVKLFACFSFKLIQNVSRGPEALGTFSIYDGSFWGR